MDLVRLAYGAMASRYIDLFGSSDAVHVDDLALITKHLSVRPGQILDLGCGPGHLTEYLRLLDVDASGIDLVSEFVDHARSAFPRSRFEVGSFDRLPKPFGSVAGVLAWYSLIHLPPEDLDRVLIELRRLTAVGGALVAGFFTGDQIERFDHAVAPAYYWPVDEFSARLRRAGFREIERHQRPGIQEAGPRPLQRPHASLVAIAF